MAAASDSASWVVNCACSMPWLKFCACSTTTAWLSRSGRLFSSTPFSALYIATLKPIPSASMPIADRLKPGARSKRRSPIRSSAKRALSFDSDVLMASPPRRPLPASAPQ